MTKYDSDINTYQITPPIGGVYAWGAKGWIKKVGTGRTDDIVYLNEHHGKTESDAKKKARAELNEWLKTHP